MPKSSLRQVIEALRFSKPNSEALGNITANRWLALLPVTDDARLTLALSSRCGHLLPMEVRARIAANRAANAKRYAALLNAHREIDVQLRAHGVAYVVLKGVTQSDWYDEDRALRQQYDIDLYIPRELMNTAWEATRAIGYEPVGPIDPRADHFPVLIRKTGWKWHGDYFDAAMPFSVELHFRFWDAATEGLAPAGLDLFWQRRTARQIDGLTLPVLRSVDALSYSALHLVRHLLRGDVKAGHVFELAHFLEKSAGNDQFWREWGAEGLASCRTIEAIAFRLAYEWFGCQMHGAAREATEALHGSVRRWFRLFAFSPAAARPNKDELWLHLCLVTEWRNRQSIAMRRMFPASRNPVTAAAHLPDSRLTPMVRLRRLWYSAAFVAGRISYHGKALLPTLWSGFRWWRAIENQP
jgi:hypothetical protein